MFKFLEPLRSIWPSLRLQAIKMVMAAASCVTTGADARLQQAESVLLETPMHVYMGEMVQPP